LGASFTFPEGPRRDDEKVRTVRVGIMTFGKEEDALFIAGGDGAIELAGCGGIEIDVIL
jgi:hypothetical protein